MTDVTGLSIVRRATTSVAPPQVIPCVEYETVSISIRDLLGADGRLELSPDIESGNYFSASLSRGVLSLRAGGYVGYVPLNNRIIVRVKPRVPVVNLTRMVEICGLEKSTLSCVRDYDLSGSWRDSLADLYASALAGHVENIALNGLMRDYMRQEETSSFPRGRILAGPTVQSCVGRGKLYRAVNTWFMRTTDTPSNRCLKYAMWLMGQHYARSPSLDRQSRHIQQRLNALYSTFDGVLLDHSLRFINDSVLVGQRGLPTHRSYYRDALDVSLAIVRQRGLLIEESMNSDLRLPSLVLSMPDLFESYVRRVLQLYASTNSWAWQVLDGNAEGSRSLYRGQAAVAATPDIVVQGKGDHESLVLEVKYIPVSDRSPREAVNQAVTYAACYETNRVVLVHPRGRDHPSGMRELGFVGEVQVFQYRYDLGGDLDLEAERFGRAVAELLHIEP